ncbi:hypothetical protein GCM10029976_010650 [Kribbella albertanoniae]|uniref:Uncharacterized protein n=1 Tax=Kribbella albertanoniae TaxID=1266829 RepID=A0A4R4PNA2_9ACTN|nr:hypothetical protein [Kribbella albertanoniae]TDC23606.1 hypothetical protein E1261_28075 [Kribbella albertanoniae]
MTDLLKDTLTARAAGSEPPPLDLDALMATGDRRIRRRRIGAALGTAFVAAAVVAAGLVAVRATGDQAPVAGLPFEERRPTYAVGGVIHFGDTTIDTGIKELGQLARTNLGFLYLELNGTTLYLTDGRSSHTVAEVHSGTELFAAGDFAGWTEPIQGGTRTVVVNLRTNQIVHSTPTRTDDFEPLTPSSRRTLVGLDDRYAYFDSAKGVLRVDLHSTKSTLIPLSGVPVQSVAASAGRYVFVSPGLGTTGRSLVLRGGGASPGTPYALEAFKDSAWQAAVRISTNGSYLSVAPNGDAPNLYDATGIRLAVSGPEPRVFGHWLSDSTFVAAGGSDLLTCAVATQVVTCQVTAHDFVPRDQMLALSTN